MLEDVGFDVSFTPIYWAYATGFPKALNIGKAVDKRLNKKREVTGKGKAGAGMNKKKGFGVNTTQDGEPTTEWDETDTPASDEAKKLDGSYAGYQPKPAVEVGIVAMKPLGKKKGYVDQALDNQKGITWLDDCRIPFAGMNDQEQFDKDNVAGMMNFDEKYEKGEGKMYEGGWEKPTRTSTKSEPSPLGRFAANLLVSDDILEEDFSRYYSLDAWWNSRMDKLPDEVRNTFPFLVVPKASKGEKNMGLDKFEKKLKANANFRPNHLEKALKGDSGKPHGRYTPTQNNHPTVKPLNLMSYLVTLGSRKNDVVLDPFMGSGTTPMACVTLSRNYIGIEREDDYFKIAEARVNKLENPIKQWEQWL